MRGFTDWGGASAIDAVLPGLADGGPAVLAFDATDGAAASSDGGATVATPAGATLDPVPPTSQGAFAAGDIVVYRVGDGITGLSSASASVWLDEFTSTGGAAVQSIALPTTAAGGNYALTASGSATSEGLLTRSVDGRYLILTGYAAAVATAGVSGTAATAVPRVIGRVDASGNINTTTLLTDGYSGSNFRGAASINGTAFWTGGTTSTTSGGVRYDLLGANTSTQIESVAQNIRGVVIADGQIYVSSMTGAYNGISTVGTGTSTTSGQSMTLITPTYGSGTPSPYQFFFADLTASVAGIDTLYVADDRLVANGGGIAKFSLVSGTWMLEGIFSATGSVRGLTGVVSGGNVTLYATTTASTANNLIRLTDSGGYHHAINGTSSVIATAPAGTAFRGVALAPAQPNHAPAGSDATITLNEDSTRAFGAADFGFSDSDGNTLANVIITTLPTAGALKLNGVAVATGQSIGAASIPSLTFTPAADANGTGYASFTFQVQDNGGVADGGVDTDPSPNTITFNVTAINDAPVIDLDSVAVGIGASATIAEGATASVVPNATLTDIDSANFDTGSLTVGYGAAATASDIVSVRDQGGQFAADRIGVSGNAIYYSTVQIGTFTAGAGQPLVVSFNAGATPAAVQALLHEVQAGNTADTPPAGARSLTFTIDDGDGATSSAVAGVAITPVNDAPAGTDKTVTVNEDATYAFAAADFGYSDVDGNAFANVVITTLPGVGTLTFGGAAVGIGQSISIADIANLTFTPAADGNGASYASFTFQVQDDGGTANGGIDTDPSPNTITVNVTAVNDAPAVDLDNAAAGVGASVTVIENQAAVVAPNATVGDIDSLDFAGGSLTVGFGASVTANDYFIAYDEGGVTVANGHIGIQGTAVYYDAVEIGTITSQGLAQPYTVSFNANATAVAVQALIRDIRVGNTSDTPPAGTRDATFTLSDGDGGSSSAIASVTITPVNDAPVIANLQGDVATQTEGNPVTAYVDVGRNAIVSDPDSADFAGGQLIVAVTNGFHDDSVGFDQDGHVAVDSGTGAVSVDGVTIGTASGGYLNASAMLTIDLNANATATLVQAVLRQLVISDPHAEPTGGTRDIEVTLNDGDGGSSSYTTQLVVTAINDAPSGADKTVTVDEDAAYAFATGDFGFGDVDGNAFAAVVIATTPASGALTLNGVAVTAGASVAASEIAAGHLVFTPATDANGAGYASFTFQVQDDGGTANGGQDTDPSANTITIDVTAINDAPVLTTPTSATVTFIENAATPTTLFAGASLSDADSPATYRGGSIALSGSGDGGFVLRTGSAFAASADGNNVVHLVLSVDPGVVLGTIIGYGTTTLAVTDLTSNATFARIQDLVDGDFVYTNASDAPGSGNRTISLTVNDGGNSGGGALSSNTVTQTLTVTAVNDAPSGTDGTVSTQEDTRLVLAATNFGFADIDGNALSNVVITTLPSAGKLYIDGDGPGGSPGTPVAAGDAIDISALNAGLLVYVPDADVSGSDGFTFQVRDNGGIANGGHNLDPTPNTLAINVTAVDDAPVAVADTGITVAENATVTIDVLANDTDVDGGPKTVVTIDGVAITAGQSVTLTSGAVVTLNADGTLGYDPHGAYDYLVSSGTASATGARDSAALQTFGYALNGGSMATVSVRVTGIDGAGDQLRGDNGNNTLAGTSQADVFNLSQGGSDTASGGAGNDGFYLGAALDAGDVLDGGADNDQLGLQGNYAGLTLGAGNLVNIESLILLSGTDTRFGDAGGHSYSYNLTTVDANVAAGQQFVVNANNLQAGENVTFNGSAETNGGFLFYTGLGVDSLTGGQGADAFFFGEGGRFTAADHVDGQGGADQLGLRGDYSTQIVFGATTMTNVETVVLLSAADTRFAGGGTAYSYSLKFDDANVGSGQQLTVNANNLRAGENATIDGSNETNGSFRFIGGAGGDTFVGGAGNDLFYGRGGHDVMTGGQGADTFYFLSTSDSTTSAATMDQITDFATGDIINLATIDADTTQAGDQAFTFIGANVAFSGHTPGELHVVGSGTSWTVEIDTNGDGQADMSIAVTTPGGHTWGGGDFAL